ncbi:response regulator [Pleurocapsales cyanobacterium LEGE 10410]|nr:response regulator [Pleurocapsales cyanobacterium LEGE 10410]
MKRILIAEDEVRLASFIEKGLNKKGFATAVVEDGQTALDMATNGNFELLLLDLGLPIKDGITVLEELRSQNNKIPVLVITALTDDKIRHNVLHKGANEYINKPFSFKDLLAKVQSYQSS